MERIDGPGLPPAQCPEEHLWRDLEPGSPGELGRYLSHLEVDFTCTGEGPIRGSVYRWCEWTAPPAELVPGTTIPFVAECTVQQRDEILRLISVYVSILCLG